MEIMVLYGFIVSDGVKPVTIWKTSIYIHTVVPNHSMSSIHVFQRQTGPFFLVKKVEQA
jgi:hypothetical protein